MDVGKDATVASMEPVSTALGRGARVSAAAGVRRVEGLERVGVEAADESLEGGHVSMVGALGSIQGIWA